MVLHASPHTGRSASEHILRKPRALPALVSPVTLGPDLSRPSPHLCAEIARPPAKAVFLLFQTDYTKLWKDSSPFQGWSVPTRVPTGLVKLSKYPEKRQSCYPAHRFPSSEAECTLNQLAFFHKLKGGISRSHGAGPNAYFYFPGNYRSQIGPMNSRFT